MSITLYDKFEIRGTMFLNTHETEAWWLERMLDKANMVTSYKAYWMMGIIEIIT